jgi:intracellular septation protein A
MQRGLPTFAVEGFAPILLFYVVWNLAGLVPAILVAAAASGSIVVWRVRWGSGGALAVVALIFVLIQAVVGLASQSATVYLAQPVVLSACWGVAYFGSVAVRRPLIGVFANVWYPFPPEFRASEPYRREFSMQSIVWGIYCLARAALRLGVLLGPGIGSFVVVSLLTGAPIFVALVFWGIWHARRSFSELAGA